MNQQPSVPRPAPQKPEPAPKPVTFRDWAAI